MPDRSGEAQGLGSQGRRLGRREGRGVPLTLLVVGAAILGLVVGSYLATLALRWPRGEGTGGRSRCDECGRKLRTVELVPVLSFLVAHGRCATCSARIDPTHPVVELLCAVVAALPFVWLPPLTAAALMPFGWLLVALATLDLRHHWLPDRLTLPLVLLGLILGPAPLLDRMIGGAVGFASLALIAAGYRAWRRREGLGSADPKLFGAIGLWTGWQGLPFVLLAASLVGLALALAMALKDRAVTRTTRLPFGTCLAVAAWPVALVSAAMPPPPLPPF